MDIWPTSGRKRKEGLCYNEKRHHDVWIAIITYKLNKKHLKRYNVFFRDAECKQAIFIKNTPIVWANHVRKKFFAENNF